MLYFAHRGGGQARQIGVVAKRRFAHLARCVQSARKNNFTFLV